MSDSEYQACLTACMECMVACERCTIALLREPGDAPVGVARLTRDCGATCWFAARFLARRSEFDAEVCRLCAVVSEACARACEKYDLEYCRACAIASRLCAERCRDLTQLA